MLSSQLFLGSPVKHNFAIEHDRNKPIAFSVLKLHDLTTAAGQLSPTARFLWILLDRLVFMPVEAEPSLEGVSY
jgi:hypothetical protein